MDALADGSFFFDLLQVPAVLLRVSVTGSENKEFDLSSENGLENTIISPGGDVLLIRKEWGRKRLALMHPGSEPKALVETREETSLPATVFGGNVAFVIGSGDQRRIAIASLRDGHVLRRFSTRSDGGMSASPDGNTLYYSLSGAIWAQPVAGGDPKRITDGIDVVIDSKGQYLYVKQAAKGALKIVRMPVSGGSAEELPVPPGYHVADPKLSPAAVDDKGRILVSVISNHKFYYDTAILDPATKSFTLVPRGVDGDNAGAGWTPDGRILLVAQRYLLSLWRYQRSKDLR